MVTDIIFDLGLTLDDQIKALITNKSSDFYKKVKLEFINQYDSFFCVKCNFFPGMLETLKTLQKRKINIHLVTNKRLSPSVKILKHFKIMSFFSKILTPDSEFKTKKKYQNLLRILENPTICREDIIYIGDTFSDKLACDAVNIRFLGVHWGYGNKELNENNVCTLKSHNELLNKIFSF